MSFVWIYNTSCMDIVWIMCGYCMVMYAYCMDFVWIVYEYCMDIKTYFLSVSCSVLYHVFSTALAVDLKYD